MAVTGPPALRDGAEIDAQAQRCHRNDREDRRGAADRCKGPRWNEVCRAQHDHDQEADDEPGNELVQRRPSRTRAIARRNVRRRFVRLLAQFRRAKREDEADRAEHQHADELDQRSDLHRFRAESAPRRQ